MNKLLAQLTLPGETGQEVTIPDPVSKKIPNIETLMGTLIQYAIVAAGISLLLVILSSGFTLLTSAGDAKAMEKGKKGLTNGIFGFFIVFVAYWLVQLVGIIFGVTEIQTIFK